MATLSGSNRESGAPGQCSSWALDERGALSSLKMTYLHLLTNSKYVINEFIQIQRKLNVSFSFVLKKLKI